MATTRGVLLCLILLGAVLLAACRPAPPPPEPPPLATRDVVVVSTGWSTRQEPAAPERVLGRSATRAPESHAHAPAPVARAAGAESHVAAERIARALGGALTADEVECLVGALAAESARDAGLAELLARGSAARIRGRVAPVAEACGVGRARLGPIVVRAVTYRDAVAPG